MKRIFLALLLIGLPAVHAEDIQPITFYVQLVRGSDQDTPPVPTAHLVGSKLDSRLRMFKWKNYWEIKREAATLKPGMTVRKQMSPERDVEISWPGGKSLTVLIYTDGKVTRKRQQSVDNTFFIAGGDNDVTESWFIVVRRDNPDGGPSSNTTSKLADLP